MLIMGRKSYAQKYLEKFETWKQEKLKNEDYFIKGSVENYITTKTELESFSQCYTKNESQKYFKARNQLPQYWFISDKGTLVTASRNGISFVKPSIRGSLNVNKKGLTHRREVYELSCSKKGKKGKFDGLTLEVGTLVSLVFGGTASQEAEELLNKYGLKVFAEQMVTLHHIEGYKYGLTKEEIESYRSYNCDISRTQFVTFWEHKVLTFTPSPDAPIEKFIERAKKNSGLADDHISVILSYGNHNGIILDNPTFKKENGKDVISVGEKELIIDKINFVLAEYPDIKSCLYYEDGSELVRGKDISEDIYDTILKSFESRINILYSRYPLNIRFDIARIGDSSIYGGLKQQ